MADEKKRTDGEQGKCYSAVEQLVGLYGIAEVLLALAYHRERLEANANRGKKRQPVKKATTKGQPAKKQTRQQTQQELMQQFVTRERAKKK
jgi:hypothetical protein